MILVTVKMEIVIIILYKCTFACTKVNFGNCNDNYEDWVKTKIIKMILIIMILVIIKYQ